MHKTKQTLIEETTVERKVFAQGHTADSQEKQTQNPSIPCLVGPYHSPSSLIPSL